MGLLVANCPRCGAGQITFDLQAQVHVDRRHNWQNWFEVFCSCRRCHRSTIFLVSQREPSLPEKLTIQNALVTFPFALDDFFEVQRFISVRDNISIPPPEHLPSEIKNAFVEGATCLAVGCHNAAATMFRLCVDLVTRPLLPDPADGTKAQPNSRQRRDLGLRFFWLFDNQILPSELRDLAGCIKEDGNDGAHAGTLTKEDADDLLDFTVALLERLITEPKRLELAKERRDARRA
jgi:Domain of unknown function (DUF4145)